LARPNDTREVNAVSAPTDASAHGLQRRDMRHVCLAAEQRLQQRQVAMTLHLGKSAQRFLAFAALATWVSACDICYGTTRSETTFRAALSPPVGQEAFASQVTVLDGDSGMFGPGGVWWQTAIADASRSEPGFGFVALEGSVRSIGLVLPLPMSTGQTLPMTALPGAKDIQAFFFEPASDRSTCPRDSVAAWLTAPLPNCSPETLEACKIERDQSFAGTVEVRSTRPLMLRLDATVSYPPQSGKAPESVAGDLSFASQPGEICLD